MTDYTRTEKWVDLGCLSVLCVWALLLVTTTVWVISGKPPVGLLIATMTCGVLVSVFGLLAVVVDRINSYRRRR